MSSLEAIAAHRGLLRQLVVRELQLKYRGSLAGYLWTLLEPLSLIVTYHLFFTYVAGWRQPRYFLIVVLGVLCYSFFSGLIQGTSRALTANAQIIRKVYVPREVFVLSRALSQLAVFSLTTLAVVPLLAYHHLVPGPRVLVSLAAMFLLLLLGTGIGLVCSCASVRYRDVEYGLSALLRVGFYLAPVAYPLERVPPAIRDIYLLNPMAVLVHLFRFGLLDTPLEVSTAQMLTAAALSVGVFLVGRVVFQRWEPQIVKYL